MVVAACDGSRGILTKDKLRCASYLSILSSAPELNFVQKSKPSMSWIFNIRIFNINVRVGQERCNFNEERVTNILKLHKFDTPKLILILYSFYLILFVSFDSFNFLW